MGREFAIHSDFLIHWTGRDLDGTDPKWSEAPSSTTNDSLTEKYLQRLENILTHGLWLTSDPEASKGLFAPVTPRVCFSELRLSQARVHAKAYGRLGIGVKRPYVFDRRGRPVVYIGAHLPETRHGDTLLEACREAFADERRGLLNFFKPMGGSYELYDECEWRILFTQALLKEGLIVDPRDSKNTQANAFLGKLCADEQEKLRYLMPLDGWFSMVIYPSVAVKRRAEKSDALRKRIAEIKSEDCRANRVEGILPIELDLDACRNF